MSVRWGIIGAGDIARKQTAQAIARARNSTLIAVMRRNLDQAKIFAREFNAPKAYDQLDDLLQDPEIDAVYIATPPYLHADQTIKAAQAGKHVLVEKPMAVSSEECVKMIQASEQNGVLLMVCYYQRFNARHQKVHEMIEQKAIGQITIAQARQCFLYPPSKYRWRQDPIQSGGGALMDVGVHCIDTLRFILGEVNAVMAFTDTLVYDYPVEDTATLLLRFQNGVQGVVSAAFTIPDVDPKRQNFLELSGVGGRIWTAPIQSKDSSGILCLSTPAYKQEFSFNQSTHEAMIEAFCRSVALAEPLPVSGTDGLIGIKIIEAAYESARSGHVIHIKGSEGK